MPDRLPGEILASLLWLMLAGCAGESSVDKTVDETVTEDSAPEDSAPEDSAAEDSAAEDSAAEDSSSEADCVPVDEIPNDGIDQDCDGTDFVDTDLDGYASDTVAGGTDCDDDNADIHPDAEESCDGVDQDCDGVADNDAGPVWYRDADRDGWGDEEDTEQACEQPRRYVATAGDCDDTQEAANPDETEICDGLDNDCDGTVDGPGTESTWYTDADRDGYGADGTEAYGCFPDEPVAAVAGDCDDSEAEVYLGHAEDCDGLDNDCDGVVPSDEADDDGDGERICAGDCDDADATVTSAYAEICGDGVDNDCDGVTDDESCYSCDTVVPTGIATIQEAIDAASSSDTICVQPGTYEENLDFGGAEVSVLGLRGPDRTTLNGGSRGSVVTFASAEGASTLLRGFTVTNGSAEEGEGIYIEGASPTLEDLVVADNLAGYLGAGIYIQDGSPTLSQIVVRDNEAKISGETDTEGYGGGLWIYNSDVLLDNVTVEDNYAVEGGGGLFLGESTATLTHVVIRGNSMGRGTSGTGDGGGGMDISGGTVSLTNVLIARNAVSRYGGGGIYASDATLSLTNVTVCDNYSDAGGGGLALWDADVTLTNVVFCSNYVDWTPAGAIWASSSDLDISYGDLWHNGPADLEGFADPTGTDGNLSVDPEHLDDTWHLDDTSALIDAGDPTLLDPDGSSSDMGAWGGPGADGWDLDGDGYNAWWLPGAYDVTTSPELDCDDQDASVYPGSGC